MKYKATTRAINHCLSTRHAIHRNASNAGDIPKLVPKLLARMAPNVRLVVLLRDPVRSARTYG
eukprot:6205017-Pleurochrysis_carterae.AAC.1